MELDNCLIVNIKVLVDVSVVVFVEVGVELFDFVKGNEKVCEWMKV